VSIHLSSHLAAFGARCGDGVPYRCFPPGASLDDLEYDPATAVVIARMLEEDDRDGLTAYVPQIFLQPRRIFYSDAFIFSTLTIQAPILGRFRQSENVSGGT